MEPFCTNPFSHIQAGYAVGRRLFSDMCSRQVVTGNGLVSWPPFRRPLAAFSTLPASGTHNLPVPVIGERECSHTASRNNLPPGYDPLILARPCDGFFPTSNLNVKPAFTFLPLYQPSDTTNFSTQLSRRQRHNNFSTQFFDPSCPRHCTVLYSFSSF